MIWSAKAAQQYAKAYDSTGQPIAIPAAVAEIPRNISNQIPSFSQGTMTTRATDVFVGDWRQLLVANASTSACKPRSKGTRKRASRPRGSWAW
jgi:hypothetical protein